MSNLSKKMKLYDDLYEKADLINEKYNPCNFKFNQGNSGELVTCHGCPYFCCEGCKHNGQNGCRVKSLSCKLWLCYKALLKTDQTVLDKINSLINEAKKENLLHTRASKSETRRILKGNSPKINIPIHLKEQDMFEEQLTFKKG